MRKLLCLTLLLLPMAAATQPITGEEEIVITGTRAESDDYDDDLPSVGLRRTADFAVQAVTIESDTRDEEKRHEEIYAMIRGAIETASRQGTIQLATGEMVIEPLTLGNFRNLTLTRGNRPDTNRASFLIKTPLNGVDAKAALGRLEKFMKAVPTVGRAEMRPDDDLTLSVVAPEKYRGQIIDLVAADARDTAARMGDGYAVQATGLDRPVEWGRASLTEVFLYVPYRYTVVPRPR